MIDQEIDYSEYFEYLDELRLSGVTNMFGASPYIQEEFGLTKSESVNILKLWMTSFKG